MYHNNFKMLLCHFWKIVIMIHNELVNYRGIYYFHLGNCTTNSP